MPYPIRQQYPGAWHHVTNRGADRRNVFNGSVDRTEFLELLGELGERYEIEVHAYCLMGNHFHLLLRTPQPTLHKLMQVLISCYTRRFNKRCGRDGPLFRGRYRSSLVETDSYMLGASRYIHRNPLEFGYRRLARFPWSSYGPYLGHSLRPSWLCIDETLRLVGGASAYRAIVESPLRTDFDLDLSAPVSDTGRGKGV